MTSVSQFAQYLLKLDPQRNQARQTLFNFLKAVIEPTVLFTPDVIQTFYARVMQFDHWQANAQLLSETVRADLHSFVRQHGQGQDLDEWAALRHPDTLQLVTLKVFKDLEDLIYTEHRARQKSGEHLRLIRLSETQILTLILAPAGNVEVKVYLNQAIVWGPKLHLVAPISQLFYSAELELVPHVRQVLDGSLLTTHCFHVDSDGVHGLITRGYTFQKFETFIRANLADTQDLFTSLKKLERHFINPQSDPYYQEMVSRLERANRLLGTSHPENLETAERALNKGRLCLKNVFPNDRLLTLLVTHLDYGINQRRSQKVTDPQDRTGQSTWNPTQ